MLDEGPSLMNLYKRKYSFLLDILSQTVQEEPDDFLRSHLPIFPIAEQHLKFQFFTNVLPRSDTMHQRLNVDKFAGL